MLYTWTIFIGIIRELLRALDNKIHSPLVRQVRSLLGLAELVQFAAFIMLHVYRLQHSGKVCAGDYLSDSDRETADEGSLYLIARGKFQFGWLIFNWVILGLCVCCCCTVVALGGVGATLARVKN